MPTRSPQTAQLLTLLETHGVYTDTRDLTPNPEDVPSSPHDVLRVQTHTEEAPMFLPFKSTEYGLEIQGMNWENWEQTLGSFTVFPTWDPRTFTASVQKIIDLITETGLPFE